MDRRLKPLPKATEYPGLRSSGMCPRCGSPVTDSSGRRAVRLLHGLSGGQAGAAGGDARARVPGPQRRNAWRCHYCGVELRPADRWHVDHRVPVSRGGSDDPDNLVVACTLDNLRKGDLTEPDYRDWLAGYYSDLPVFGEETRAAIAALRAPIRKPSPSVRRQRAASTLRYASHPGDRGPRRDTRPRFLPGCRLLVAVGAPAPTFSPLGRAQGCRGDIIRDATWRDLGLSAGGSGHSRWQTSEWRRKGLRFNPAVNNGARFLHSLRLADVASGLPPYEERVLLSSMDTG